MNPRGQGRALDKKTTGLKRPVIFLSCGERDLNPHDITATRSLVWLVCQFRHLRKRKIDISIFNLGCQALLFPYSYYSQ